MFVFTDPNVKMLLLPPDEYAWAIAAISIGSPTGVPVPCVSTKSMSSEFTPARAKAN